MSEVETRHRMAFAAVLFALGAATCGGAAEPKGVPVHPDLAYINTGFENASPLWWEVDADGAIQIHLVYDQERSAPNRANGHWFFEVQGRPGSDLVLVLNHFDNVWNGRLGSPISEETISFLSPDGKNWEPVQGRKLEGNRFQLEVHLDGPSLYVARLEPYRIEELECLKREIADHPLVEIAEIGHTVEGRPLEIIRVGKPDAAHHVLLRARAHPWEPGGSWVVQGLIRRLTADDADAARCLDRYCVWIMPMANKDGVARGRTRFNVLGKDLNRDWGRPADPKLAPENHALERWLEGMIAAGRTPGLAVDFHNDNSGKLHVSRPEGEHQAYLASMQRFEKLLRRHTWFTEGSTGSSFRNPGTFGEGLLARYGIPACILELNANWIAGVDDYARSRHWERFGAGLAEVCYDYFAPEKE